MRIKVEGYISKISLKNKQRTDEKFRKFCSKTLFGNNFITNNNNNNYKSNFSFYQKNKIINSRNNTENKNKKLSLNLVPFLNIKTILKGRESVLYTRDNLKKSLNNRFTCLSAKTRVVTFSSKKRTKNYRISSSVNRLNFFSDYEKDFFPNYNFSNLQYKETEIYGNDLLYENLIKDKISYFQREKNENKTIKLEKQFIYGKYKKNIKLTLNSLMLTFEDMEQVPNSDNKILKIDFPLSLLPLFYYKGFESFLKLLTQIIKIENNFEKVIFDEDAVKLALNEIKDYKIITKKNTEKNGSSLKNKNKYENKGQKQDKPIILKTPILNRNKNFLKYNNFIFYWTTNTKCFTTKIILPRITLDILGEKIKINHYIDYELLFFLYKRNFLNWEYYIIKHLSSYSKFRSIIRKLDNNIRLYNKNFFLKEPKTKINSFFDDTLLNIYTDQFNRNQIIEFKSFYINIYFSDLNYSFEKKYHIFFNFVQYLKLYEISKYSDKIYFLIKFLEINNETHSLNFNFREYDEFDINAWMDNIKKFSSKSLKNNIEEKLTGEFEIYSKKVKIEFRKPKWSFMRLENEKEKVKSWEIGKELEIDFVQCMYHQNSESWTTLINECLKKINEPIPILPQLSSKKKFKRMATKNFGSNLRSKGYRLSKISQ